MISENLSDFGYSSSILVKPGEKLNFTVSLNNGFDGSLHIDRSSNGGQSWDIEEEDITVDGFLYNTNNQDFLYRFRCELDPDADPFVLTGDADVTLDVERVDEVYLQTETIGEGDVVSATKQYTNIDSTSGAGSITLAAPDELDYGMVKTIEMTGDGGDIALALTNVVGGSAATTATFSAVGQALVLLAITGKWLVLKEYGVVLA